MAVQAKTLPQKEKVRIRSFWYSDYWVFPKLITVITTLDKHGRVNAGALSHIMQYDVMHKKPRQCGHAGLGSTATARPATARSSCLPTGGAALRVRLFERIPLVGGAVRAKPLARTGSVPLSLLQRSHERNALKEAAVGEEPGRQAAR